MASKKASLSLSVNAIVILIIAITMLGLALGFVKMMFSKVSDDILQQVEAVPEPEMPSTGNPVTLSNSFVIANPGKTAGMKISLYNPTGGQWSGIEPNITCKGLADFDATTNSKNIQAGKYVTYGALLNIPGGADEKTYLCQVQFNDDAENYSSDFTIRVEY